jgi:glycosyltransferase involved in cell wall biosynthesis
VTRQQPDWSRPHHIVERTIFEYGIRNAGTIIAQTRDQKSLLAANYGRNDAIVVRNFHPLPSATERKQSRANDKKRIIWVGNVKPVKNPEAFIRLARSFSDDPDLEFVMIGAPQGKPSWMGDITMMMRSAPNLHYLGGQAQEQINELLWDATAVVNTSHSEGFSNVFIQAWMRGVPVVSLNSDPDGLLEAEAVGFASGSEQQLHDDVAKLIRAPGLRQTMGDNARRLAEAQFSEQNVTEIARLMGLERAKP